MELDAKLASIEDKSKSVL